MAASTLEACAVMRLLAQRPVASRPALDLIFAKTCQSH
jgi:hypothetical protein